jgi:hypothetical protein
MIDKGCESLPTVQNGHNASQKMAAKACQRLESQSGIAWVAVPSIAGPAELRLHYG